MKNELDSKWLLAVYEAIQCRGEATDKGKFFQGLYAYSDYDGYTLYIEGNGTLLRFGFHNTYHLDYEKSHQKQALLDKINQIYKDVNE